MFWIFIVWVGGFDDLFKHRSQVMKVRSKWERKKNEDGTDQK
jgi:hypothetical protein